VTVPLFEPLRLRSLTLRNRIVVSPMCQYSSDDGFANDWHLVHLGGLARGGASIVIAEATGVSPEGRISPYDLGIWKDEHIEMLSRITSFIAGQGAIAGIQLAHAGRKASVDAPFRTAQPLGPEQGGWTPLIAPSAIPLAPKYQTPVAMSHADIDRVIGDFRSAAQRALLAGFRVIELHGAHGYLLHEFLSPISNTRSDEYGGSFDNRIRFVMRVIDTVRTVWPEDLPLMIRVSATDWVEGGWDIDECIELSRRVKAHGVDLVDSSSGGNVYGAKIPLGPGYQVRFAEAIKHGADVLTGAVGLITKSDQANQIIATGKADVVILARELLRDPHFPLRAARELGVDIKWPPQYERAKL
jgi:2,4-dienoyl-CoA reductase-like NADH-dependent reductase (Old Yellow Enzyme family)